MRAYLNGKGDLVEQRGIEPLTSALRTRRSAKLSYCPTRISILPFQVSGFKFQLKRDSFCLCLTSRRSRARTEREDASRRRERRVSRGFKFGLGNENAGRDACETARKDACAPMLKTNRA